MADCGDELGLAVVKEVSIEILPVEGPLPLMLLGICIPSFGGCDGKSICRVCRQSHLCNHPAKGSARLKRDSRKQGPLVVTVVVIPFGLMSCTQERGMYG